jgi:phosphate starvation-inducible membrane PsiE
MLEKVLVRQLKGSLFHIPIMFFIYIHIDSLVATTLLCGVSL